MSKTLSPLVRLVLFMICLSIAGSIVAGAHYYAVDLPQQQTLQAPTNLEYECTQCAGLTDIAQKIRCNYVNVCS